MGKMRCWKGEERGVMDAEVKKKERVEGREGRVVIVEAEGQKK